ncbi:MAG: TfoX/Sxy family protein [Pseudohongiellaceae bacterium]
MPTKTRQCDFAAHIVDLLQGMGPVYGKRMFGGHGIFLDGLMFGLIADNVLYLKVDDDSRPDYEALDLAPFTYHKQGKPFRLNYYQAPEEAMEDVEVMLSWGNGAFAVALRAASRQRRPRIP